MNLFGTQFVLDGTDITDSLSVNVPFTVNDRDVTLSGLLHDGSPFSFDLKREYVGFSEDYFHPDATLTVTLFSGLLGDYNGNGIVDAADYVVWRDNLGAPAGTLPNDPNVGLLIGEEQYDTWATNFGSTSGSGSLSDATVPEPASALLLIMASVAVWVRRRSRA